MIRPVKVLRAPLMLAALLAVMLPAPAAHAGIVGGVADLVHGVLSLPLGILAGTFSGPPVIGTLNGALSGTFNTFAYTTRGLLQLVGASIPVATTVAPYLPLFL